MSACISTDKYLDVQWEEFTSKLDIMMYYVAISDHLDANGTNCKSYVSTLYHYHYHCMKVQNLLILNLIN